MKKKKISKKQVVGRCPKCRGNLCDRYEACLDNYKKSIGAILKEGTLQIEIRL